MPFQAKGKQSRFWTGCQFTTGPVVKKQNKDRRNMLPTCFTFFENVITYDISLFCTLNFNNFVAPVKPSFNQ